MNMDHNYARSKLELLLRDLNHYSGEEFWRQMSRIAAGATGASHAEGLLAERDTLEAHAQSVADAVGYTPDNINRKRTVVVATSISNMKRFADYLHAIEREFLMVPGEPDPDYPDEQPEDECLVNCWGAASTIDYVDQFRAALASRDDEQFRQGFWWGFDRARCNPDQMNIQSEYLEVAALRQQRRQAKEPAE